MPEACGAVDEAQAAIGVARVEVAPGGEVHEALLAAQRDLYVLMAELATPTGSRGRLEAGTSLVAADMVLRVERTIDEWANTLDLDREFVIPPAQTVAPQRLTSHGPSCGARNLAAWR